MDEEQLLDALRREFPELAEELDDELIRGLFYLQVGAFTRYVQRLIDTGAKAEVLHCFAVAERGNRDGNDRVQNAVGVAFLEHLNFQDGKVSRAWAFALLPPSLRGAAASLGIAAGYRPR